MINASIFVLNNFSGLSISFQLLEPKECNIPELDQNQHLTLHFNDKKIAIFPKRGINKYFLPLNEVKDSNNLELNFISELSASVSYN